MQRPPTGDPDAPARVDRDVRDAMRLSGGPLHPRWLLLATLGCVVLVAAGGVLWYTMPCLALPGMNGLCQADGVPGVVQAIVVGALFVLLWLLAWMFGEPIHEPRPRRGLAHSLLRSLSDFEALRPVVTLFGATGAALAGTMVALDRVQPLALSLAALVGLVAVWTYCYRPPREPARTSEQARLVAAQAELAGPINRLRQLPLVRYLWPNRPPEAAAPAANGGQP
jgi:hypothetical protein